MTQPGPQISSTELLERYVRAGSDEEAEKYLAELRKIIHPLMVASFRKDFHVSMRDADGAEQNQDALELAGDAELSVLRKLRRMREAGEARNISTLEGYVRTVTRNAFSEYVRRRRPVWTSLRNQIRYVLTRKAGLFIRRGRNEAWICGCSGAEASGTEEPQNNELTPARIESLRSDPQCLTVPGLVEAVLAAHGKPISLEQLVSEVYAFRKLREPARVEEEHALNAAAGSGGDHGSHAEQRELLEKLWSEIEKLPVLHRRVLLLNLTNRQGESLIAELPLLRVASIEKIAAALEFTAEEFASLWGRLPLSDNEIAERLGLSRQQVINLRHSARASLKRRLDRDTR